MSIIGQITYKTWSCLDTQQTCIYLFLPGAPKKKGPPKVIWWKNLPSQNALVELLSYLLMWSVQKMGDITLKTKKLWRFSWVMINVWISIESAAEVNSDLRSRNFDDQYRKNYMLQHPEIFSVQFHMSWLSKTTLRFNLA